MSRVPTLFNRWNTVIETVPAGGVIVFVLCVQVADAGGVAKVAYERVPELLLY